MAKLRKWIGNLKVSAKLQVYRMAVLVMTAFLYWWHLYQH